MLKLLEIQNIALINHLKLELSNGLNILSGETGAGKSIIIDSFNFVMGERADKSLIRHNQDFAIVQAVFENYQTKNVLAVMEKYGMDINDELILYRKMSIQGKNECRVNGKLYNLSVIKELTSNLADIHGQHEHQSLLNPENHIVLLDKFADNKFVLLKSDYEDNYNKYIKIKNEIAKFTSSEDRLRKLDILNYQINEIQQADLKVGEEEEIKQNLKRMSNVQKISENLSFAIDSLYKSDYSADNAMNSSLSNLGQISEYDEDIEKLQDRLSSCEIELKDIAESLEDVLSNIDYSEQDIENLQNRYDIIKSLERKYGKTIEDVLNFLNNCISEQQFFENSELELAKLEEEEKKQLAKTVELAKKLSEYRKKVASSLQIEIQTQLGELGMKNAKFAVEFEEKSLSNDGIDNVEFMISANLGEPLKPLAKVISGGEMSRFMLAMKVILADIDSIFTMVFDEIDTGISGVIASVVANKMYKISKNRQVIAVTHLPQLTAIADKHYLIEKSVKDGKTNTNIFLLDMEGSIKEIARLIAGENSNYGMLHAKEMKESANLYKQNN